MTSDGTKRYAGARLTLAVLRLASAVLRWAKKKPKGEETAAGVPTGNEGSDAE